MNLSSVSIESFRGFGRRTSFELGGVNILGGPNGFGKTSFFDAILWCLFESIPRLSGTRDFVAAGDILQNKFYPGPYSVELTFQNGDTPLSLKRTCGDFAARLGEKNLEETMVRVLLGLEGEEAIFRFLRTLLLQQDKVNEFVHDLNPRGRYDSMVSLLELRMPQVLSDRLGELGTLIGPRYTRAIEDHNRAQQRVEDLQLDVQSLNRMQSSVSSQLIEERYKALLSNTGQNLLERLGFDPANEAIKPIRDRVLTLILRIGQASQDLREMATQAEELERLREKEAATLGPESPWLQLPRLEQELAITADSLRQLEAEIARSKDQIADETTLIENAKKSETHIRGLLAEIRSLVTSDTCPVCLRPIKQEALIKTIDSQIGSQATEISKLVAAVGQHEKLLQQLQARQQELKRTLESQTATIEKLRSTLEARRRYDSILQRLRSSNVIARWKLPTEDTKSLKDKISEATTALKAAHENALQLTKLIDQLEALAVLPERVTRLENTMKEVEQLSHAARTWQRTNAVLQTLQDAVSRGRADLVEGILQSHKPLIRALYKRMNPHPLFTDIDFEIGRAFKDRELYFKVFSPVGRASAYPSTLFSTSQLNVLAVCVFLALNLRVEPPMAVMMLDDPIHSMDDLNVLGFCDVMRQMKRKRQLYISTHNRDLYGLLLNKLRPSHPDEKVKGFWFEGWTEEGPQISEQIVDYLPNDIPPEEIESVVSPRTR